jgi:hypothetical protein
MHQIKTFGFPALVILTASLNIVSADDPSPNLPFGNRIIFSQTPEIGRKWHAGLRNKDLLCWDFYWNINNWLTFDFLHAGFSGLRITDKETGDSIRWSDRVTLLTLKSRPLTFDLFNSPYKIAVGLTAYSTLFEFYNPGAHEGLPADTFAQAGMFITQSWYLKNRKWWIFDGSHYFNLLSSFESHKISDTMSLTSWYFIPGYRFLFNRPRNLSFDFEYYYMSPYELPIKTVQALTDPDKLPFENPNLYFVSFMFWGFSWSWKHAKVEAHIGHHISFTGPVVPAVGFGWDF